MIPFSFQIPIMQYNFAGNICLCEVGWWYFNGGQGRFEWLVCVDMESWNWDWEVWPWAWAMGKLNFPIEIFHTLHCSFHLITKAVTIFCIHCIKFPFNYNLLNYFIIGYWYDFWSLRKLYNCIINWYTTLFSCLFSWWLCLLVCWFVIVVTT